jgi:hypothetical protein
LAIVTSGGRTMAHGSLPKSVRLDAIPLAGVRLRGRVPLANPGTAGPEKALKLLSQMRWP